MTYSHRCQHCNGLYCTREHETCLYCLDQGISPDPIVQCSGWSAELSADTPPVLYRNGVRVIDTPVGSGTRYTGSPIDTDWVPMDPWGESIIQPREIIPIDVGQWQPSAETIKWELPAHEEFDLKYVTGIPVEQLIADPSFDPISAVVNEPSPFFESAQCSSEVPTWSLPPNPFATQGRLLADLQSLGESILADDLNDNTPLSPEQEQAVRRFYHTPLIADDQQMRRAQETGELDFFSPRTAEAQTALDAFRKQCDSYRLKWFGK